MDDLPFGEAGYFRLRETEEFFKDVGVVLAPAWLPGNTGLDLAVEPPRYGGKFPDDPGSSFSR